MSSKDDEIISMDYSNTSKDNAKKKEEANERKLIKNKSNGSIGKKQNLFKSPSSSALKSKQFNDFVSLPELNNNNSRGSKNKLNFTTTSFNKKKDYTPVNKNGNRTFNFSSNTSLNNMNLYKQLDKDKIIKNKNEKEESQSKTIELLKTEIKNKDKIIESLITSNNNSPNVHNNNNNNIVNILSTKKSNNTKNRINGQEEEEIKTESAAHNDSKVLEKKYNTIRKDFEKQQNKINTLRKEEKISKNIEIEMKNRILSEQCNKLNYLYFDVLKKLVEYEDSIKNIHKLKEDNIKKDYIILELKDKYSKAILDINKNNQEISDLKKLMVRKNNQLKQNKKNLDYYSQLTQKLFIDNENIYNNPKILALKNDYESQINEYKKSLSFYKGENYRKDLEILKLNTGSTNLEEMNMGMGMGISKYNNNLENKTSKKYLFKNAQKVSKEHFTNKENIELKNKINILHQKIDKLTKNIKEYEIKEKNERRNRNNKNSQIFNDSYMGYNPQNINNTKFYLGNSYNQIESLTNSNENIEDEDCDFMSNYNMNEFLYILKKCFEAQYITISDIESKVLNGETFNLLTKKENYNMFILTISANFCNLLKIMKTRDQLDTLSFVKTFLYNNFIANENKIDEFQKIFLDCFPDIVIYNKELEDFFLKKISGYFKDKIDLLTEEFNSFDLNKKGTISFIALKKIVEKLKINLKKEILEYMIFFMKKSCINNENGFNNKGNNYSLRDLDYKALLEHISSHINNNDIDLNNNSNLSNNFNNENNNNDGFLNSNIMNDDNSFIEITNEEYNEKITLIMNSISNEIYKKSNNGNNQEYINKLFSKYIITDDEGHQVMELSKLVDEIKTTLFIELNQIEIFCLYTKFKINEDKISNTTELIDYESFKNEIIFYENQKMKENASNELVNSTNKNVNNEADINGNDKDIEKKENEEEKEKEKNIENYENNDKNNNFEGNDENNENNKNNENNENYEDIKKGESQIDEYNDFENNNFDNEEDSINKLEKIITGDEKE